MNRANVCCFTGHRPESLYLYDEEDAVYAHIFKAVEDAIFDRYTVFMCGGCRGGDFLFGEAVVELRNIYPEIRLVCVLPFRGQAELWSGEERNRYADLLDSADEVICLNDKYQKGCMHERNRALVDGSDVCVAYLERSVGGSAYTYTYALKNNLEVINIYDKIKSRD